jgi:signal transduction histidine kinase
MTREAQVPTIQSPSWLTYHEIAPLNAILAWSWPWQRTDPRTGLPLKSSVRKSFWAFKRLLDFSKIEPQIVIEQIDFDSGMLAIRTVVGVRVPENVEFVVTVEGRVPRFLLGDPLRLGQVFINLAGNAAKFTHEGEIRVGVFSEEFDDRLGARLRFEIMDTGIGMKPDQVESLFTPFARPTHRNTGLRERLGSPYPGTSWK